VAVVGVLALELEFLDASVDLVYLVLVDQDAGALVVVVAGERKRDVAVLVQDLELGRVEHDLDLLLLDALPLLLLGRVDVVVELVAVIHGRGQLLVDLVTLGQLGLELLFLALLLAQVLAFLFPHGDQAFAFLGLVDLAHDLLVDLGVVVVVELVVGVDHGGALVEVAFEEAVLDLLHLLLLLLVAQALLLALEQLVLVLTGLLELLVDAVLLCVYLGEDVVELVYQRGEYLQALVVGAVLCQLLIEEDGVLLEADLLHLQDLHDLHDDHALLDEVHQVLVELLDLLVEFVDQQPLLDLQFALLGLEDLVRAFVVGGRLALEFDLLELEERVLVAGELLHVHDLDLLGGEPSAPGLGLLLLLDPLLLGFEVECVGLVEGLLVGDFLLVAQELALLEDLVLVLLTQLQVELVDLLLGVDDQLEQADLARLELVDVLVVPALDEEDLVGGLFVVALALQGGQLVVEVLVGVLGHLLQPLLAQAFLLLHDLLGLLEVVLLLHVVLVEAVLLLRDREQLLVEQLELLFALGGGVLGVLGLLEGLHLLADLLLLEAEFVDVCLRVAHDLLGHVLEVVQFGLEHALVGVELLALLAHLERALRDHHFLGLADVGGDHVLGADADGLEVLGVAEALDHKLVGLAGVDVMVLNLLQL